MTVDVGDGWEMRLGSCLDGLRTLGANSVDVTITDPPYEEEAHTKQRRGLEKESDALPFSAISDGERTRVSIEIARVTRRWALVFCQVESAHEWALCLTRGGLEYVRTMVWVKPDAMPQYTGDRPGMGYESIVAAHRPGPKRWNGHGRVGVFFNNKNGGRPPGESAPHPTTKPPALIEDLVSLFSDPGELVLDPFAGSGTTGAACRKLGRRFLGWEINHEYFEMACRRIRLEAPRPHESQLDWLSGGSR